MSIEEAAAGICSPSYLSLIENGKRPLTSRIWTELSARLGGPVEQEQRITDARIYDELTSSARLLQLPSDKIVQEMQTILPTALMNAIQLEASGDYRGAASAYSRLLAIGITNEQAWHEVCGFSSWSIRMLIFIAEQQCRLEADANNLEAAVAAVGPVLDLIRDQKLNHLQESRSLFGLVAGIQSEMGNTELSFKLLDELSSTEKSDTDRALDLWLRGQLLLDQGRLIESAFVLRSATELLRGNAMKATEFRLLNATVWSECLADTQLTNSAFEELASAVHFFRRAGNTGDLASCLNTLAFLGSRLGLTEFARSANTEALSLSEQIEGPRKASLQSGMALVFTQIGEDAIALDLLRKAREMLELHNFGRRAATVWAQMSHIFESLGDTQSSVACLKASLSCLGVTGAPLEIANTDVGELFS
jgi:tetratricopeptide (TPR) repeat protein